MALWVKRYLIIIPTLETPLLPLQDMRPEYIHYTVTPVEWMLTFAGIAMFILLFFLFSKFLPIVNVVKVTEDKSYGSLREIVADRILKRQIKELKIKERQKFAH